MTSPSGATPDEALGNGADALTFAQWQAMDEAGARARMKLPFLSSYQGVEDQVDSQVKNPLVTAQRTANGIFATKGPFAPNSAAVGDVWIDTSGSTNVYKVWNGSGWDVTTDQPVIDAADTATSMQNTGVDNSSAIDQIQRQISGDVAGGGSGTGLIFNEPFDISVSGSPNWTVFNPSSLSYGQANGEIRLNTSNNGHVWFLNKTPNPTTGVAPMLSADDFDVSIVIGSNLASETSDGAILFRANNNFTNFGYLNYYEGACYLGWGTRSSPTATTWAIGVEWTPGGISASITTGKRLRVTGIGNNYTVYLNNTVIFTYTDSAGTKATGTAYRYTGFRMQQRPSGLFTYLSSGIANFSVADITPPTYLGTGWHLYKSTTVDTGIFATTADGGPLTGLFTVVAAKPNITVSDSGSGTIQIQRSGWYMMSATIQLSLIKPSLSIGIQASPDSSTWTTVRRANLFESAVDISRATGSWVVYCSAGSYVRPCVINTGSTTLITGETTGSQTNFSGALISG